VVGGLATIKVERGALVIRHKPDGVMVERRFDQGDDPPHAILFDARGEWLSGEALRWCARRDVVLVIPDGPGRMMTVSSTRRLKRSKTPPRSPTSIRRCSLVSAWLRSISMRR
jgi:hypothetical protein